MIRQLSALVSYVRHSFIVFLIFNTLESVFNCKLLGVVEAAVELDRAVVDGLDHVTGVVTGPPLGHLGVEVHAPLQVHVHHLLDPVPGVAVGEGGAEGRPPEQQCKKLSM